MNVRENLDIIKICNNKIKNQNKYIAWKFDFFLAFPKTKLPKSKRPGWEPRPNPFESTGAYPNFIFSLFNTSATSSTIIVF